MTRFALLLIALLALALPASASAQDMTETRSLGNVQAELSYYRESDFAFERVRLKITRDGTVVHDALVPAPCDECPVIPQGLGDPEIPSLSVVPLDQDGETEVLVDLYTGGAHCCSYTQIYSFDATANVYRRFKGSWGDYGYQLRDTNQDGTYAFESRDFRFAAAFTAYAASGAPPRIFRFENGKLVNVTREFRSVIKKNLKDNLRLYKKYRNDPDVGDVRGWLAAYVADKYLLGQADSAFDLVNAAYRRGELRALQGDSSPSGKKYISQLRKYLRKWGYR